MTTPTLNYEIGDLYERQADLERNTWLNAARSLYQCPECGSNNGMIAYDPEAIELMIRRPDLYDQVDLYQYRDATYALFAICDECNAAGIVPPGYSSVTREDVVKYNGKEEAHGTPRTRDPVRRHR